MNTLPVQFGTLLSLGLAQPLPAHQLVIQRPETKAVIDNVQPIDNTKQPVVFQPHNSPLPIPTQLGILPWFTRKPIIATTPRAFTLAAVATLYRRMVTLPVSALGNIDQTDTRFVPPQILEGTSNFPLLTRGGKCRGY